MRIFVKLFVGLVILCQFSFAHFFMILPSNDVVDRQNEVIKIDIDMLHTFEMKYLNIQKPKAFGYYLDDKKTSLLTNLKPAKFKDRDGFTLDFRIKKEGLYIFYAEPKPYFEPSEDVLIKHYSKVMIEGMGISDGYEKPIGLEMEIVPLVKPFGLFAGNSFTGKVLYNGKPLANAKVYVSYLNEKGLKAPTKAHSYQVVQTNSEGNFTYTMPFAGWWVFNALVDTEQTGIHNGKMYPIELGTTFWVKAYGVNK